MGRTPACVNPDALVTGHGENSTKRCRHDNLLRHWRYLHLTRPRDHRSTPESNVQLEALRCAFGRLVSYPFPFFHFRKVGLHRRFACPLRH